MIIDQLENAEHYFHLHPAFARAFEFLRRPDLAELALAKHSIDGDRLLPSSPTPRARTRRMRFSKPIATISTSSM